MQWQPSFYGLSILLFMYGLLFLMFHYYHWDKCRKLFVKQRTNNEDEPRNLSLIRFRDRMMSESCPGGMATFQNNIKKPRALQGTTSLFILGTQQQSDAEKS